MALQEKSNNNKKNYQKEHSVLQQEYDRICKRLREEKRKKNEIMVFFSVINCSWILKDLVTVSYLFLFQPEIHLNKEEKITKVDENSSLNMDDSSWSFPVSVKYVNE